MNLQRGKHLPDRRVVYLPYIEPSSANSMSPASRATLSGMRRDITDRSRMPVALYRAVGPAGKRGSKLRRASEISLTTPGLDLATKLRVFQRALRSRVEQREALVDIVRAVNTTLE